MASRSKIATTGSNSALGASQGLQNYTSRLENEYTLFYHYPRAQKLRGCLVNAHRSCPRPQRSPPAPPSPLLHTNKSRQRLIKVYLPTAATAQRIYYLDDSRSSSTSSTRDKRVNEKVPHGQREATKNFARQVPEDN